MRQTTYEDFAGRRYAVLLPDHAPDSDAVMGVPVGPPDLSALGLPLAQEVRLHNELFARGLLTERDVTRRPQEVVGAVIAAFKADAVAVIGLYRQDALPAEPVLESARGAEGEPVDAEDPAHPADARLPDRGPRRARQRP